MNCELICKDIQTQTFLLTGMCEDKNTLKNLTNFVKKNKDSELNYKTNVKGSFSGFESLNDNEDFTTFIKSISDPIKLIYNRNFVIKSAWGNILYKDGHVTPHSHSGTTAFCGILYLSENGPGTYFQDYDLTVDEKIGKFVLFSPCLKHKVEKITTDIERITIAFNMNDLSDWDSAKLEIKL